MPPSQRADARRNRARILDVAEEIFAERGPAASTDEIARAAGVGIGTLFRHFPAKEDLIREVFVARLRKLADEADRQTRADDPGAALATILRAAAAHGALKNALGVLLDDIAFDTPEIADVKRDLNTALATLLANAQRSGAARTDLRLTDLIGLLAGLARAMDFAAGPEGAGPKGTGPKGTGPKGTGPEGTGPEGTDPEAADRLVAVVLAGLRP